MTSACTQFAQVTIVEAVATICFSVSGSSFYVLLVGLVSSALSSLDAASQKRQKRLAAVNAYMRYKRVPVTLRKRMNDYYTYLYSGMQVELLREGAC